eukprot:EG_transcript_19319
MNALLTRIACSLRARPHRALSFPGGKRAAVALLLRQRGVEVDLFFILRAVNPRDLWSGQVGLPGGRCQAGETDETTAIREVEEEVGFVLPQCGTLLGRLDDRKVEFKTGRVLVVCCFVYMVHGDPQPTLDPREVAACGWAPLAHFTEQDAVVAHRFQPQLPPLLKCLARGLRMSSVYVTGSVLPIIDLHPPATAAAPRFLLWGLTWGMVNDFLVGCRLVPQRLDQPRFWFGNAIHDMFRIAAERCVGADTTVLLLWRTQLLLTLGALGLTTAGLLYFPLRSRM